MVTPLSKYRDERSESYGRKEGKGRFKTTLPIADCRLLIGKTKTTSNQQQTIDNKIGNLEDSITTLPIADCGLEKISSTLRLFITHKY